MQSVDRGLYSAAESLTQRDKITGERTLSLDNRAEQIEKGNEFAQKFISEAKAAGKKLNEEVDPVAYRRIVRIFSRLHEVSHLREEQWTPVLVEANEWNAFTTGGTYFVVFSGLERDLQDDSELANVIAHEVAHTVANHVFERHAFQSVNSLAGSKSAHRDTFKAAFTHENEAEADRIAVLYCALAGFDPYAGARIWERQYEKSGDGVYVHDHPMNSERAALAKKTAETAAKYYVTNLKNPEFETILKKNDLYSTREANDAGAGKGGGLSAVLQVALTTANQRNLAKLEEQRQQRRIRFIQSVQRTSKVVGSKPVASNTWEVKMNYFGNLPLTDVALKLIVNRNTGAPLVVTKPLAGILRPNTTFAVTFESPELDAYQINPRNVAVTYDNARNLGSVRISVCEAL